MGGFDIRRASENLGNIPGGGSSGMAGAVASSTPYRFRDQAGGMVEGVGRALDKAAEWTGRYMDHRQELKDDSDFAAMKTEFDKKAAMEMNRLTSGGTVKLSQIQVNQYKRDMDALKERMINDRRPSLRVARSFRQGADRVTASGQVRLDGVKLEAEYRMRDANLASAEAAALERHSAFRTAESLEGYWQAVYSRNEGKFGSEVANQMANTSVRQAALADRISEIKAASDDDRLDRLAESLDFSPVARRMDEIAAEARANGREPDFKGIHEVAQVLWRHGALHGDDKGEREVLEKAISDRRRVLRAEHEQELRDMRGLADNARMEEHLRITSTTNPVSDAEILKLQQETEADKTTYEGIPEKKVEMGNMYRAELARRERARREFEGRLSAAEKEQMKSNEDALSAALCRIEAARLDGSLAPELENQAQAALWDRYYDLQLKGGVSTGFMNQFMNRMKGKLSEQEASAMRKFYQAFGYQPDLAADGGLTASAQKAAKDDFTYYYAPVEEDGKRVQTSGAKVSAADLVRYGDALLRELRTLGPGMNREGVVDKVITRLKTDWISKDLDANIQATARHVWDIQREARARRIIRRAGQAAGAGVGGESKGGNEKEKMEDDGE